MTSSHTNAARSRVQDWTSRVAALTVRIERWIERLSARLVDLLGPRRALLRVTQ